MPVFIKHPIFLSAYQIKKEANQDKVSNKTPLQTPITFFIAEACYPLRFWQTMVFGRIVLLLIVVAILILLSWTYATPAILWLAHFFIISNDMTVRFNEPYCLPLPFLGRSSSCQARPLATLYADRIEWYIAPVDTSVDDNLNIVSKLNSCLTNTNFVNRYCSSTIYNSIYHSI